MCLANVREPIVTPFKRLTNFFGKLLDPLVSTNDVLAEKQFLDSNLRLYAFRKLLESLDFPCPVTQGKDSVI